MLALSVMTAIAVAWAWWRTAWLGLYVHGAYRDLDARGVINYEALEAVVGAGVAGDWGRVVSDYLLGGKLWNGLILSLYVTGALVALSIVVCCWTLLYLRRGDGGARVVVAQTP
jgi:hypothetical protein